MSASDFVEFSNFMSRDRKYSRHCGQQKEFDVNSDRKFFRVTFKSNDRYDGTGFNASYVFMDDEGNYTTKPPTSNASTLKGKTCSTFSPPQLTFFSYARFPTRNPPLFTPSFRLIFARRRRTSWKQNHRDINAIHLFHLLDCTKENLNATYFEKKLAISSLHRAKTYAPKQGKLFIEGDTHRACSFYKCSISRDKKVNWPGFINGSLGSNLDIR